MLKTLYLFLFFYCSTLAAAIVENSSLNTPYPLMKNNEKIIFEASGGQKLNSFKGNQKQDSSLSLRSYIPVTKRSVGLIDLKSSGLLTFGYGIKILNEYEYSLYTPNVFFYLNQSIPAAQSSSHLNIESINTELIPPRPDDSRAMSTIGFFTYKELDTTDLYSDIELKYHHPRTLYTKSKEKSFNTQGQFSTQLDLGFNTYIRKTRFSAGLSTGGELRTPLSIQPNFEQDELTFNNHPYVNIAAHFSYSMTRYLFLKSSYRDEKLVFASQNKDSERSITLKLQYHLL